VAPSPFHPDLRAHPSPIDEPLAPITQIGHQVIDGFDLVDFLALAMAGSRSA
jgi:hypothetical protein